MILYALTFLIGILALLTAASCVKEDMRNRQQYYKAALHTAFAVYDRSAQTANPIRSDLYHTCCLIGRRRRKCDLCLDFIGDKSIAKVHAVLTLENGKFHIKPYKTGFLPGRVTYPEIFVNGQLVPHDGCSLYNGDLIRLGNSEFYLMDTKEY